jgi:N-acetylglucosaminyl-diphospho-decaprenol L-rhamnosyltransferase
LRARIPPGSDNRRVLSIVVPTYNTAELTLRCCRAARAAAPDAQLIVVDDASTDGTAELLTREFPDVQVLRRITNGGFAVAANDGVRASRGEIVLLLNSDALLDAQAPAVLLRAFADNATLGIASPQLYDADGTKQWTGGRTPTLAWMIGAVSGKGHWLRKVRSSRNAQPTAPDWLTGAALIFRREVWDVAGPLATHYRFYCQDIDFCLRARAAGWSLAIIDDAHVTHVRGATIGRAGARRILRDDLLTFGRQRYGRRWFWFGRAVLALVPTSDS